MASERPESVLGREDERIRWRVLYGLMGEYGEIPKALLCGTCLPFAVVQGLWFLLLSGGVRASCKETRFLHFNE